MIFKVLLCSDVCSFVCSVGMCILLLGFEWGESSIPLRIGTALPHGIEFHFSWVSSFHLAGSWTKLLKHVMAAVEAGSELDKNGGISRDGEVARDSSTASPGFSRSALSPLVRSSPSGDRTLLSLQTWLQGSDGPTETSPNEGHSPTTSPTESHSPTTLTSGARRYCTESYLFQPFRVLREGSWHGPRQSS